MYANVYSEKSWITNHIKVNTRAFPKYENYEKSQPSECNKPATTRRTTTTRSTKAPTAQTIPYVNNGVYTPNQYKTYLDDRFRFKDILPHPPANLGSCDNAPTSGNAFPWIAYLVFSNMGECTGTIVGDREIITSKYKIGWIFFTPKFLFFYTKIFVFFHLFFYTKNLAFLQHFFTSNFQI